MNPASNNSEEACRKLDGSFDRNFGLIAIGSFGLEMIGLLGNAISILVLIGRFLRRDIFRLFLSALCAADMGTLICAMFMLTIPEFAYKLNAGKDVLEMVNQLLVISFPIGHILKTCSCWLVAVMSFYRFVYVKSALNFRRIGSRDIAKAVIACIFILSFLFNLPRLFELKMQVCRGYDGELYSELGMTALRSNQAYLIVYHGAVYTACRFVLPVVVILFCNCYLLGIVIRSRRYRRTTVNDNSNQNATSVLLVCVSFAFLLCNSFSFMVTAIELTKMAHSKPDPFFLAKAYAIMTDISNFLTITNASINFILYLAFSNRFRTLLAEKIRSIRSAAETSSKTRRDQGSGYGYPVRVRFAD